MSPPDGQRNRELATASNSEDDRAVEADPERLLSLVSQSVARLDSTKLIAIDGPAGSGKTTLASQWHDFLRNSGLTVETLHLDDLYEGWTGLHRGLETRLIDQVLNPLASGQAARWQRYDWHAGAFAEWVELTPPKVLILEGCGSGAQAYSPYSSLLVWIEAEQEERITRGIQRDGPGVLPHWLAWMDREAAHFAANRTRDRADLHLTT